MLIVMEALDTCVPFPGEVIVTIGALWAREVAGERRVSTITDSANQRQARLRQAQRSMVRLREVKSKYATGAKAGTMPCLRIC